MRTPSRTRENQRDDNLYSFGERIPILHEYVDANVVDQAIGQSYEILIIIQRILTNMVTGIADLELILRRLRHRPSRYQ